MRDTPDLMPDRTAYEVLCPLCEATALHRRQCKSVCGACGYVESCEDNFVPNRTNPTE